MELNEHIPEVILQKKRNKRGSVYLTFHGDQNLLDGPELKVRIRGGKGDRVFPVFRQNAMNYGKYSDYINHHGCACCSLTTLLAAFCPAYRDYRPEDTIDLVERKHFPETVWKGNYEKALSGQMPVSLYGISGILSAEGVANQYVGNFRRKEALFDIRSQLMEGLPVVIETSRIRYGSPFGLPVAFADRKYAGSYHTMILLGLDRKGNVVFTDSASREWAGRYQRIKRDRLSVLLSYMFPQIRKGARNLYFDYRWNTGGYIKLL